MSIATPRAVIDRDRLLNDLTNTGVIAALLGGFAARLNLLDFVCTAVSRFSLSHSILLEK